VGIGRRLAVRDVLARRCRVSTDGPGLSTEDVREYTDEIDDDVSQDDGNERADADVDHGDDEGRDRDLKQVSGRVSRTTWATVKSAHVSPPAATGP